MYSISTFHELVEKVVDNSTSQYNQVYTV